VADGDRLGKTIIFAKNHNHAEFIADRFNANYPHYKGEFARVIDFKVDYAQSLIDNFSNVAKAPHIAISVDMLDTGIDIPEIVNLVFLKLVRSKTKFWQMVGRGTRLCADLFGPGKNKKFFYVFDYCQNLEFFSQNPSKDWPAQIMACDQMMMYFNQIDWNKTGQILHIHPSELPSLEEITEDLPG
jgi:type I restriction enzyme R subunit